MSKKVTTRPFPFDGIKGEHLCEMTKVGITVVECKNDRMTNFSDEVVLEGGEDAIRIYIAKLWGFGTSYRSEEINEIFEEI